MIELLFESIASLIGGAASFFSGVFTQQAIDKTISIKKLFTLIFLTLGIVMVSIELSCLFSSSCSPLSWKTIVLEIFACTFISIFSVVLVKIAFFIKKADSKKVKK